MASSYERYMAGEHEQIWNELCLLGSDVRKPEYFDDARAVARETMQRLRSNGEILISRLQELGWGFGYEWAGKWAAEEVAKQPPLLGEPTSPILLDNIEAANGLLPIALRLFYEVVGSINFVGQPFDRPGWPGIEDGLDPLYISGVAQTFKRQRLETDERSSSRLTNEADLFVSRWPGRIEIAPDPLHKYFISGVGSLYVEIPASGADPALMFEGDPLQVEDRDLTLVRYLRYAMEGGGFLAFMPGWVWDARSPGSSPQDDLSYLTRGLQPI